MPENKEIAAPGEHKLLYFERLSAYAHFLLEHRLEDFSTEIMRLMRETGLPLVSFFEDLTEKQRKDIALQNTVEFLTYLSENKPGELIELSIKKWLNGQLPVIEREVLGADEINAICYIRKRCFLTFLPFYTADLAENNRIIAQIDEFTHRFELACHKVFKVLQQEALTSRRHMIKRIEHTEELYEQAQKITHIGNWVWHIDQNRVIWSNELYRIYGLAPQSEEITFERFISLVHPEDRERVTQQIQQTLQTYVPNDFYHRIVLGDGTVKTLHARGEILMDEQGRPSRMVGTGQDVSEQRQREWELKELNQHLEEKEQNFRHLIQNAPDAIIVIDEEGKILLWNAQAEKTFGWSAAEVAGSLLVDTIILSHQRGLFTEEISIFFAAGEGSGPSKIVELTTQNKAGARVEVSLAISKTTQKGKPAFVAFLRDVSDRKKAEAELNASRMQLEKLYAQLEQNYDELEKSYTELIRIRRQLADDRTRFLINTMPHMVASAAPDGMLDYANQRLMDFTGFTFDELKGWGWGRCIHHEDLDKLVQTWRNSLETGMAMQIEFRMQNAEGKPFWHLANVKPHRDEKGEITMWIASITNIHEHRMMEEKKDEFIGIASHELKTPLTSAKAYMQLLEAQLRKTNDEESMLYVRKATTSIERINDLISELLDISKIQHGKLPLVFKEFDFNEMMDETIELIQQTSPRHKILKTGAANYLVTGDKERLRQVCVNLLTNAVKYSPKGENVDVRITNDHDKLLVAVSDYGIGIPKGEQEKIFERFYRVEGVGPQYQGLGIGLFITAEIVRRHKGKIWVKSEQGKGSTFYFTVPFKFE